jgi:uncharacterized SAM-binding protein YcdF (DUF218 family)
LDTSFFLAPKLSWTLARPESWIILFLIAGLFASWKAPKRTGRKYTAFGLVLILCLGMLPIGEPLMRPLETRFPANPLVVAPSGIIILGGAADGTGMQTTGLPGVNEAAERYLTGMSLARVYPAVQLIFSGA